MELLDPFEYLPYDKIYEICEGLDDKSLSQIIRTSKKARETCQIILSSRKEKYEAFVEESFGPIFGYIQNGEFYIKNFFSSLICGNCHLSNLDLIGRQPRAADEVRTQLLKCLDCNQILAVYDEGDPKCSSYTKVELLLLADRIGFRPESFDLNQYSKGELCQLLRSFFERHGRMRDAPI